MLRFSNEYPQSITIQNHRFNLDIFVHTFFPTTKPKLMKILRMMEMFDDDNRLIPVCRWLLTMMEEDITFYRLHSYKRECKQLEQNILQVRIFIGA